MATNTYVALASVTAAGGGTSQLVMSSIPSGYTDLHLVISGITSTTGYAFTLQVNGDTGSNYSQTLISGNGSVAQSSRYSNATNSSMYLGGWVNGYDSTAPTTILVDFMNYSNSTTYKTILWRSSSATRNVEAGVMLWRGSTGSATQAITSITVNAQSGSTISSGSTFTLYGIAAVAPLTAKATGGTISYGADGYVYHTFTSSGTFAPTQSLTCDYLVVGGGGGTSWGTGGGGGAGGLRSTVRFTGGGGTAETPLSLSATSYTVTVGAPGASTTTRNAQGGAGGNSTFATITATGGAGGGGNGTNAATGGSGGGGSGTGLPGAGTANQGYAGGNGADGVAVWTGGGGGGGAGGVGQAAGTRGTYYAGNGGVGVYLPEFAFATNTGSSGYYAGGGGGGGNGNNATAADGVGGLGGGGNGSNVPGRTTAGATNTGGGGGGSGDGEATGKPGGSGIVIVRYLG